MGSAAIANGVRWRGRKGAIGVFFLLLVLVCWGPVDLRAQGLGDIAPTVAEIRIEGNQRIEDATLRTYLQIAPGDEVDASRIDRTLKSLFATGLFADVNITVDGRVVVIEVVENPIINRIAFEGNRRLEDDELQAEVDLRPRVVFTRTRVQNSVQRIVQLYQNNGRFGVVVEPKIIRQPQNRVDVVFEVDEGELTKIEKINFIGNKQYSDRTLRGEIASREEAFWRVLTSNDRYNPDRIAFDREQLRRFYLARGYADFQVTSSAAELSPDRDKFYVTFNLFEGERYRFGEIDFDIRIDDFDAATLDELVATETGEVYNAEEVDETVLDVTFEVGRLGYAFAQVIPDVERDEENRLINITYVVEEGPRVYVERIDIVGNVRTLDKVVRREFRLAEGDAFNTAKLRRSRGRIQGLGFFSSVDVETLPGSSEDRSQIRVTVTEQSTGELSFGAGYSTDAQFVGNVGVTERNLLGRGQTLRLGFTLSADDQRLDLSFTEPYFLDREIAAGFDIFRVEEDNQDTSSFDELVTGIRLRAGFPYNDSLFQRLRYTIQEEEITNLGDDVSQAVRDAEGESLLSVVGHTLIYEKRDNRLLPTEGYYLELGNDVAGLGGDEAFFQTRTRQEYHHPFFDEMVVGSIRLEQGAIAGLGEDVTLANRFSLGGASLRGFESDGIGPRDTETDDTVGGNLYYRGSVEVRFPIPFVPDDIGLMGRVWNDFGSLWQTDDDISTIDDGHALRAAAGLGLTWASPFGPVSVDFGEAYMKEDFDDTESFRFSFGTAF